VREFERYKLSGLRKITGALQLLACLGLFLGFSQSLFTVLASLLLSVMMIVALAVRIRLRDSLLMTAPAVLYFVLSLFLLLSSL
jgi:uncharacterized membrane protein YkgB